MFSRLRRRRFDPDFVFVVTYGRSGSTLVQGLLNTLPETLVRGENGFYFRDLFRSMRAATTFAGKHANHAPAASSSAFYGVGELTRARFVDSARELAVTTLLGDRDPRGLKRLGFKEVLWHQIAPVETEEFFEWFEEVFPGARYVLNTRDIAAASTSGFWQHQDPDKARARIDRVVAVQDYLRRTRPERTVDVRYEVVTGEREASDAELTRLATFVTGSCDAALLDTLRETLAVGHGPNPFGGSRRNRTQARG